MAQRTNRSIAGLQLGTSTAAIVCRIACEAVCAQGLVEAKRSTFRNRTHAAESIQADVRAYARSLSHPLGERIQTITDMLKGITFGKSNTQ